MYGFVGCIDFQRGIDGIQLYCSRHNHANLISGTLTNECVKIERNSINKFENDKVFFEDESVMISIEGLIYNFSDLEEKFQIHNRGQLLSWLYTENGIKKLAALLDGYYSGVIVDKKINHAFLLTDHMTYKPMWYAKISSTLYFSTDIDWLYHTMIQNGEVLKLDYNGAYCLLNYGYMLGDVTPVQNVKKLLPGHYLSISKDGFNLDQYYAITAPSDCEKNYSKEEYDDLLDQIDVLFSNAVNKVYRKDEEYGYKHCATLSGGLDSRLVVFMAKRLGYKTVCLTMGESECPDIRISSRICNDQFFEHVIYELNNGAFLLDYDKAIEGNGGTILSPGYLHSYRLKSLIDLNEFGAVHSGDAGDAILGGSLCKYCKTDGVVLNAATYGTVFLDKFSSDFKKTEIERYPNQYLFNFYNRGLNSAGNGCIATQCFTECGSPFIDKELMSLLFSLPYQMLSEHKLYIDYMKKHLPNACEYKWDGIGCKPTASRLKKEIVYFYRAFNYKFFHKSKSMNPYDKWYHNNKELQGLVSDAVCFANEIKNKNDALWNDIMLKLNSVRFMDKSLACTLLHTIRKYNISVE